MSDLLAELDWRGFVHHATRDLAAHLATGRRTLYCGFGPTAPSFQVGNLMPLMLLRQFQLAGHRPIVLMGGGTGLIAIPAVSRTSDLSFPRSRSGRTCAASATSWCGCSTSTRRRRAP